MFIELTDETFTGSVSQGLNIVVFYKDQCPFCNAMKKIITKFSQRPAVVGKTIGYFQINRETSPKSTEHMDVTRIPAVFVFRDGRKIHAKSGDITYKELERMIA
ncbi:MAG: thioredoxin family protein [Desulfobacteraceae bacterium]|jgi:thioredoxin 1